MKTSQKRQAHENKSKVFKKETQSFYHNKIQLIKGIKFTGSILNNCKHILLSARWKVQDGKEGQGEAGGWAATFGRDLIPCTD